LNKAGAPVGGLFSATPKKVIGLDKQFIHDVACGDNHSLALDMNRDVFGWGSNLEGQLGIDMSVCTSMSQPRKLILYEFMNSSNREHFVSIQARKKYSVMTAESRYIYVSQVYHQD